MSENCPTSQFKVEQLSVIRNETGGLMLVMARSNTVKMTGRCSMTGIQLKQRHSLQ